MLKKLHRLLILFQNMGLSVSELRNATWNVDCAHKIPKKKSKNHFSSKHNVIKNGTPMIEVMIPVGNSLGLTIILHNMSANNKIIALKIMLKGISFCDFGPTIFRAMWGAMSPRKFIVPPAHTTQLVQRAPMIRT